MIDVEIMAPGDLSMRARRMITALIAAAPGAGVRPIVTDRWSKKTHILMSYGLGHPIRHVWTEAHVAAGGRLIGWDLAYWDREHSMRCTIDHPHPWRLLRDMPTDRWERAGIKLREDYDPDGPIVLVGMGKKSRRHLRTHHRSWERETAKAISRAHPGRRILYKPKTPPEEGIAGCKTINVPMDEAIKGASLVVVRHSNAAVDACIAGIPVVCEDGAARALYGNDIAHPVIPNYDARLRFLQNLAHWQWQTKEAHQAWIFLLSVLG